MQVQFDDLAGFKEWWLTHRPINTPAKNAIVYTPDTHGVVLYREAPYQVELFSVRPNCVIPEHIHPNVDSYEVFVSGDIKFSRNSEIYEQNTIGSFLRVTPKDWHGGHFGQRGGCFISIQKWLNDVEPSFVGDDWRAKDSTRSYRETFN